MVKLGKWIVMKELVACSIRSTINKTTTCQMLVNYSHHIFGQKYEPMERIFEIGYVSQVRKNLINFRRSITIHSQVSHLKLNQNILKGQGFNKYSFDFPCKEVNYHKNSRYKKSYPFFKCWEIMYALRPTLSFQKLIFQL